MTQRVISLLPEIWLMVLIVALSQLSETVYTSALPDIAISLGTSHSMVEYTLTIFLFGLAVGTLFWGKLSDKVGRKPALLAGLGVYTLGCIGCYYSTTITALLVSRFIQAFGGSTGSVLGQVICRDAFHGSERGKVFSIISTCLALSPALGPIIGGAITQFFHWTAIFLFLIAVSVITFALVAFRLPETYVPTHFSWSTIASTALLMLKDRKVWLFGLLVGLSYGLNFCYFAEGSFCLINYLGLSPSAYGSTFLVLSCATMMGGLISKNMNQRSMNSWIMITLGVRTILAGALLYVASMMILTTLAAAPLWFITAIIVSMAIIMFGVGILTPNVLSIALKDYQKVLGTASSLFGFYYYCLISLLTFVMGMLHNHTLWPMPLYFLCVATLLNFVCFSLKKVAN